MTMIGPPNREHNASLYRSDTSFRQEKGEEFALLQMLIQEKRGIETQLTNLQDATVAIQKQLEAIDYHIKKTIRSRLTKYIRGFFDPRIGRLNQYDPRILISHPKRYRHVTRLDHPPLISIVTPSYNQGHFLERTIASVLMQDYKNLEYIIQDGGSTDQTPAVLAAYQQAFKHCESKKDNGQSHALNKGFKHANGEIMAYLNSDDLLMMGTLHYVADYFARHPDVDVVYGHRVVINEHDEEIGRWILPAHDDDVLLWADYIPQETLFWRRRMWEKAGAHVDENFHFAMDWDLLLRFKAAGAKFARLPRFLGAFRVHQQQKTSAEMPEKGKKEMMRLRIRCHGRPILFSEVKKNVKRYEIKHLLCHYLYKLGILRY